MNRTAPTQVFVLSTGRSGSRTIAELLSAIPGCRVVHEPAPKLIAESRAYVAGEFPHWEMTAILRRTRDPNCIGGERLSGESNQRLSFVLPALHNAFPHARYVWLIRDGRDAVASFMHRLWYHRQERRRRHSDLDTWARHRIRADEVGEMTARQWSRCDAFARCCWYWSYSNRLISRDAARLDLPHLKIRLEELPVSLGELSSFLGLDTASMRGVPHSNASAGEETNALRRPLPWQAWSRRQLRVFDELAGDVMETHYPERLADAGSEHMGTVPALRLRTAKSLYAFSSHASRPLRSRFGLVREMPDSRAA